MPVTTIKRSYLKRLLGFSIDDKALAAQVAKMGFEADVSDRESVSLEVTPNRPDLLDAVGFVRSLKNYMHKGKKLVYDIKYDEPALLIHVGAEIKAVRPFISGFVALKAELSDDDIANLMNFSEKFCDTYGRSRRKIAIGMHNLGKIKPPLFYELKDKGTFTPLNGKSDITFEETLKDTDKGRRYGEAIKSGKNGYPVLEDSDGPIALIPILNSDRTRVDGHTRNIFVDITGSSEYTVNKAAELFACSFMDLRCDVRKVKVAYTKSRSALVPKFDADYLSMPVEKAEAQIGVAIGYNNVISLANKMGYEAALVGKRLKFRVPSYRLDIINDQDLIEDLAIAYGYDYIQPVVVYSAGQGGVEGITHFANRASELMIGLGFSEAMNSYLTNDTTNFQKMNLETVNGEHIRLRNPKASSINIMRSWILPSLLGNLSMSIHDKMPQDLFEVDRVFYIEKSKVVEALHLGAVSCGSKANFNNIKEVFEELNYTLGLGFALEGFSHKSFIEGRCARITSKRKLIGFLGEIHPGVLGNFGIEEPAVALEVELHK